MPLEEVAESLDIKEGVLETVITLLELDDSVPVALGNPLHTTCRLTVSVDGREKLAQRNAVMTAVMANAKKQTKSFVEFEMLVVARAALTTPPALYREIGRLQRIGQVKADFSSFAVALDVAGEPDDIDALNATLYGKLQRLEDAALDKLDCVYHTLGSFATNSVTATLQRLATYRAAVKAGAQEGEGDSDGEDAAVSAAGLARDDFELHQEEIRAKIVRYFEGDGEGSGPGPSGADPAAVNDDDDAGGGGRRTALAAGKAAFVRADIRVFLQSSPEVEFTGRAVARIMHAIHSPRFPSLDWNRHHMWGRHVGVDFRDLRRIATAEIVAHRARMGGR